MENLKRTLKSIDPISVLTFFIPTIIILSLIVTLSCWLIFDSYPRWIYEWSLTVPDQIGWTLVTILAILDLAAYGLITSQLIKARQEAKATSTSRKEN